MIPTILQWRPGLDRAATLAALAGGFALTFVALFTVAAVIADAFGAPVLGDSEVVELIVGACVASFMPLCQMRDGHVAITLFTDSAPRPVRRTLETVAAALTLVVAALLTWRMGVGGLDAMARDRTSMFLQLPLWWGYLGAFVPSLLWVLTAAFVLVERIAGLEEQPQEAM